MRTWAGRRPAAMPTRAGRTGMPAAQTGAWRWPAAMPTEAGGPGMQATRAWAGKGPARRGRRRRGEVTCGGRELLERSGCVRLCQG